MNPQLNRHISVLGVPMDLGADRRGVDMGPSAIRCAGLEQRLEALGYQVADEGDLLVRRAKLHPAVPDSNLKYLYEIVRVNEELCERVAGIISSGRFPLVIGGDHSIAIGTLAGVGLHYRRLGVIWYDTHGDANTAETSPSGNIHGMPLASALGHGHPQLISLGSGQTSLRPQNVVIVGARSLDPGEKLFLKEQGIRVYTMRDIDRLGMAEVMEQALAQAAHGTDGVHLSVDLDALDPSFAPGVGTPVPGGISYRESRLAMELLSDAGVVVSAEFVEVNPTLDVRNSTAKVAVDLIGSLFGERIC
ncbi:arginase [Paenibacillus sp. UNCCL117]|uniref:arginase n=1 Tax=unclassified Paenibacillus TaxID=185978 RepID=UPI00088703A3|nr:MULTISPECIES: arginase [unclassified Paenibacillus]SDE64397.1 arginase [Paenibacillus sp. cl123]SFW70566.1 arginase [Paenibacillus sp. UNCCL117]